MRQVWKKYKLGIIVAGYIAAVWIAVVYLIIPLRHKASQRVEEIQKAIIDNEINRDKADGIPEMEEQYRYFQEKKLQLDGFLDSNEEADFIRKLETLSEETNNKISLKIEETPLKPEKKTREVISGDKKDGETKEDIISTLPYPDYIIIKISLEGTYEGLFRFIQKLENFEYYINVISLKLEKVTAEKEKNAIGYNPFTVKQDNTEVQKKETAVLQSEMRLVVYVKK